MVTVRTRSAVSERTSVMPSHTQQFVRLEIGGGDDASAYERVESCLVVHRSRRHQPGKDAPHHLAAVEIPCVVPVRSFDVQPSELVQICSNEVALTLPAL